MSGAIQAFTMPKWGLTMEKGTLTAWLRAVGDRVEPGMEICEVETEKIANAVESPVGGILRRIVAAEGEVLPVGALLAIIADETATDEEVDAVVMKFQASYVPPAAGESEAVGPRPETIEVAGRRVRHLIQRGAGEAVVLVHGFGGNLENWLLNHGALAAAGWTVAALDLPGHGESSKPVDSGSLEELSAAVLDYMDAVEIERAHLVGHSMGAAICLAIALRAPERVRSLTLIGPAGLGQDIDQGYVREFIAARDRRQLKPVLQMLFADESLVTRQLVEDTLKYKRLEGVAEALSAIAGAGLAAARPGAGLRDAVGRVPTLVIWGSKDAVITPPDPAAFTSDDAELHVLQGYGHMVQVEAAAEVNRLIEGLIRR